MSYRFLYKGRPKTRKTVSIASWPGKHYIFLFDPDGEKPLYKHFPERMASKEISFDFYHSDNLDKADAKMRELLQHNPYQNISIDSLTFGGQTSMDYGLDKAKKVDNVGFVRMPGQREYGVEHNVMMALIGAGVKLSFTSGCNFFLSAHVMERQIFDADGKLLRTKQRLISGGQSLAEKVLAMFKEVWHFEDESDSLVVGAARKYKVYTKTKSENIASSDLNCPDEIDITNKWLYEQIKDKL